MTYVVRAAAFLLALVGAGAAAQADVLDRIRETGTIRLAHRTDAAPFSSLDSAGQPVGYSIELCRRVAAAVIAAMPQPARAIRVEFVQVSAVDRFEAITSGRADLLCEATTVTLGRREQLDFTLYTFVSGAGMIVRRDSATASNAAPAARNLRTLGVLQGTTTEAATRRFAAAQAPPLTVVPVETHDVAIGLLRARTIDAYVADRDLLAEMLTSRGNPGDLLISEEYLTIEPYALAMRRGEDRLRLLADRALAGLYRSGEILDVFRRWIAASEPSGAVRALYVMQSLAD
jgi:polar amino acid transport system substrate-binding protein/glutamate/aspartate transport system substrate-binding protein